MHNGFVNIDGEKMSKSLNNFTTIRGLLETCNPMAVRLFILQAHYRTPIDFTEEAINVATKGWISIRDAVLFDQDYGRQLNWQEFDSLNGLDDEIINRFREAMDDDFNSAIAISIIYELAKTLSSERNNLIHAGKIQGESQKLRKTSQTLKYLTSILGFVISSDPDSKLDIFTISDQQIEEIIQQRKEAKKNKNWAEGDRLRHELKAQGITLIDQAGSEVRWHRS